MDELATHSSRLRHKVELVKPTLDVASAQMWRHKDVAGVYHMWLLALHGMIRATVPLMLCALHECMSRPHDDVCRKLARYFAKHIREEFGHDDWVAEDLAHTGTASDQLTKFVPGPEIAALVGSQYYWIRHVHPVALVGHIAVLEGYPPAPGLARTLSDASGLPCSAFQTIERHATLDVKHRDEVMRVLDSLPLTSLQSNLVGVSALASVRGLIDVIQAIMDRQRTYRWFDEL